MSDTDPAWLRLESVGDVREALRDVARQLLDGTLTPREGNATTTALRALQRAMETGGARAAENE